MQVLAERDKLPGNRKPPLLVKIAPDLTEQDKSDISAVCARKQVSATLKYTLTIQNTCTLEPLS